ncbi:MAG: hypothetical protein U0V75_13140 [Ferruginibacter sp.]
MHSQLLNNILQQNAAGLPVKDFLQQLVKEYPYFTPGQFFLLQQLDEQDAAYPEQAAKTSLLFNNPHWLHYKLQQTATARPAPVVPMYAENADNDDDNAAIVHDYEAAPVQPAEIAVISTGHTPPEATPVNEVYAEESDNDDDNAVLTASISAEAETASSSSEAHTSSAGETVSPGQEISGSEDNAAEEAGTNNHEPMPNIKISLKAPETAAPGDKELSFEPMHLVDYFASQGIKLSEELQTGDKLGKQLKSFTEWLKTMKKVHNPANPGASSSAEVAVQALAEKSNAENEILTEAMAQVFTQQGKTAKAIELYEKLSLLNPAKSAYFAAQIDKLKG